MPEILEDRLARLMDPEVHLRGGAGSGANGTIDCCVNQATNWLLGGSGKNDSDPSIDRVIRGFSMRLNDSAQFKEWRNELKPFAVRQANTAGSPELLQRRLFAVADYAVREVAPLACEAVGKTELASSLREVAPVVDRATADAARLVARAVERELRKGAADAASAAYAAYAADAASAADAADAASAAYAAYAADAASAAYAAYAADAAKKRREIWDSALAMLGRLCDMKEAA